MPTYDEDIVAAAAALKADIGAEDEDEVQRFVVMFRALEATRPAAAAAGIEPGIGFVVQLSTPLQMTTTVAEALQMTEDEINAMQAAAKPPT